MCALACFLVAQSSELWKQLCFQDWSPGELNLKAYHGNYQHLYRDRNGWRPKLKISVTSKRLIEALIDEPNEDVPPFPQSGFRFSRNEIRALGHHHGGRSLLTSLLHESMLKEQKSQLSECVINSRPRHEPQSCIPIKDMEHLAAISELPTPAQSVRGSYEWIESVPKFAMHTWTDCPEKTNIMDARASDSTLITITSHFQDGTHSESQRVEPLSQRSSKYFHFKPSPSPGEQDSDQSPSAAASSTREFASRITIRNLDDLAVTQRLSFPTQSLNCLDGGKSQTAFTAKYSCFILSGSSSFFLIGDALGDLLTLQKRNEDRFELRPLKRSES